MILTWDPKAMSFNLDDFGVPIIIHTHLRIYIIYTYIVILYIYICFKYIFIGEITVVSRFCAPLSIPTQEVHKLVLFHVQMASITCLTLVMTFLLMYRSLVDLGGLSSEPKGLGSFKDQSASSRFGASFLSNP